MAEYRLRFTYPGCSTESGWRTEHFDETFKAGGDVEAKLKTFSIMRRFDNHCARLVLEETIEGQKDHRKVPFDPANPC